MVTERALLVNSSRPTTPGSLPLGLMAIATEMQKRHQIKCQIVDLPQEQGHRLEDQIDSFWDAFDFSGILFVGFSTMCNTLPRSLSLARRLRSVHPDIPIIFGGPDASSNPEKLIETYPFIDAVVIGEAESVLDALLDALPTGPSQPVPGLWFHQGAGEPGLCPQPAPIVSAINLPLIDYSTYPRSTAAGRVPIEVGRGCPYTCTFCSTKDFFRRRFRLKAVDVIIGEIEHLHYKYEVGHFDFIHDLFTANRKLVVSFCEALIYTNLPVTWSCSVRPDCVDLELLRLLRRAGCRQIYFGIETGSRTIQKRIRKNLEISEVYSSIKDAIDVGLDLTVSLIIGFPFETKNDLIDTINMILNLQTLPLSPEAIHVYMFAPLTGTEIEKEYAEAMHYDGHITAMTAVNYLTEWEEREIRRTPRLFSSFYYCGNPSIPRSVYKWLHAVFQSGDQLVGLSGSSLLTWAYQAGRYPLRGPDYRWTPKRWQNFLDH